MHRYAVTSRQRGEPRAEGPITSRSSVTDGGLVLAIAEQSLAGNPTCCRPNVGSVRRELVKRILTYPEPSLIKSNVTNLRSNCSTAHWHTGSDDWSNAAQPRENAFARIIRHRPTLEMVFGTGGESCIKTLNWEGWFQFRNSLQRNAATFGVHRLLQKMCMQLITPKVCGAAAAVWSGRCPASGPDK
jgi:hypothetical protein